MTDQVVDGRSDDPQRPGDDHRRVPVASDRRDPAPRRRVRMDHAALGQLDTLRPAGGVRGPGPPGLRLRHRYGQPLAHHGRRPASTRSGQASSASHSFSSSSGAPGVLANTAEHSTGMIRASLTAVPKRLPLHQLGGCISLVVGGRMAASGLVHEPQPGGCRGEMVWSVVHPCTPGCSVSSSGNASSSGVPAHADEWRGCRRSGILGQLRRTGGLWESNRDAARHRPRRPGRDPYR